jgi:hypothetical protein
MRNRSWLQCVVFFSFFKWDDLGQFSIHQLYILLFQRQLLALQRESIIKNSWEKKLQST